MIEKSQNALLKSEKGWILIDSLLGMVILSTAIIALLLTFTQATKGSIVSTNRTQATYLAQQTLENLKLQDGNEKIDMPATLTAGKYIITIEPLAVSAITKASDLATHLKPYCVTVKLADTSGPSPTEIVQMVGYGYVK